MSAWIAAVAELHDRGEHVVLVSVAATRESAPREAGSVVSRAKPAAIGIAVAAQVLQAHDAAAKIEARTSMALR